MCDCIETLWSDRPKIGGGDGIGWEEKRGGGLDWMMTDSYLGITKLIGVLAYVRGVGRISIAERIPLVGGSTGCLVAGCVQVGGPCVLRDSLVNEVRRVLR